MEREKACKASGHTSHRRLLEMGIALIDSQSLASRPVKHLLQGRDRGCRMSSQPIQGHEIRGLASCSTRRQVMLHHHVILLTPIPRNMHIRAQRHIVVPPERKSSGCSRTMQSDEILNPGQKKSGRLCGSPSLSLWLRSWAQHRFQAHLYSWRSATCIPSNVLSLLKRKTDMPCAGGERVSLLFSCHPPASCG